MLFPLDNVDIFASILLLSKYAFLLFIFNIKISVFYCIIYQRIGAIFPQRTERSAPVITPPQTHPLTSYPQNLQNPESRPDEAESSAEAEYPTLRYIILTHRCCQRKRSWRVCPFQQILCRIFFTLNYSIHESFYRTK